MRVPTYNAGATPTVTTASPKSGASPVGEAIQSVGSILGNVSEALTKAEVLRQVNEADLKWGEVQNQIAEKARLDNDPNGFDERRKSELTEALPTVSGLVKHPIAKQQFDTYLSKSLMDFEYKLHMAGVKKLNDNLIAQDDTATPIDLDNIYQERNPIKRQEIIDKMVLRKRGLGDVGAITREQEKARVYEVLDSLGEGQFNYDLGAAQSIEDLENIGKLVKENYYTNDPKVKNSYSNAVKTGINRLDKAIEEQKETDRTTALIQAGNDLVNGEFSFQKLKDLKGIIKPEDEALLQYPRSPEAKDTIRSTAISNLIQDYVEDDSPEQASNLLTGALKQYADGKMTAVELGIILDSTQTFLENRKNPPKGFWRTVGDWVKNIDLENLIPFQAKAVINTYKRALELFKEGKSEPEAAQQAIEESKTIINPNKTKYKIGDPIVRGNLSGKVIGYDEIDGEPIIEWK